MTEAAYGLKNTAMLTMQSALMQGFIVSDYEKQFPKAIMQLSKWVHQGKIHFQTDMQQGFENIPDTLTRLFTGKNTGKQLLKLADPPMKPNAKLIEKLAFKLLT